MFREVFCEADVGNYSEISSENDDTGNNAIAKLGPLRMFQDTMITEALDTDFIGDVLI